MYLEIAEKAAQLHELGMSDRTIARALGVTDKTFAKSLRETGVQHLPAGLAGVEGNEQPNRSALAGLSRETNVRSSPPLRPSTPVGYRMPFPEVRPNQSVIDLNLEIIHFPLRDGLGCPSTDGKYRDDGRSAHRPPQDALGHLTRICPHRPDEPLVAVSGSPARRAGRHW